jgi:hypothetical protein
MSDVYSYILVRKKNPVKILDLPVLRRYCKTVSKCVAVGYFGEMLFSIFFIQRETNHYELSQLLVVTIQTTDSLTLPGLTLQVLLISLVHH